MRRTAEEIIEYISTAKKVTPVKLYLKTTGRIDFSSAPSALVLGDRDLVVLGDWEELKPILDENAASITDIHVENDARNSAIPLLDLKGIDARIEPGAIIRDEVEIGNNAVIMMGALINIGAVIGEGTMIDMGVIMGGRATVGNNCHIGAGAVLAGVIEPASATPVIVEDGVVVGANAVILEGCRIGEGAVVAAGAIVVEDVPAGAVVAGAPAKVVKMKDDQTTQKTALQSALRNI